MSQYTMRSLRQDPHRVEFAYIATFNAPAPKDYDTKLCYQLVLDRVGVHGWNDLARAADRTKHKHPSVRQYAAMSHYAVML